MLKRPFLLAVSVMVVLQAPRANMAQMGTRTSVQAPSVAPPSARQSSTLGRVGGNLSYTPGIASKRSPVSLSGSGAGGMRNNNRGYRRPGVGDGSWGYGYQGYGGLAAEESNNMGGGRWGGYLPLLGGNVYERSPGAAYGAIPSFSRMPASHNILAAMHSTTLQHQKSSIQAMGVPDRLRTGLGYLDWAPREMGAIGTSSPQADTAVIYQPVVSSVPPPVPAAGEPKQTLAQLVNNHLVALRQGYITQGWRAFQGGEYQVASRLFSLAENTALDVPADRAYLKVVMAYCGIAAGQYAQTCNSLTWLMDMDPQTSRFLYAGAFNRIFDENNITTIAQLYEKPGSATGKTGYQSPLYTAHNQAIESMATQDQSSTQLKALMAIIDWGRGRRANAIFTAKKIPVAEGRLSRLGAVLEEAERLRQVETVGRSQPAAPVAPGLAGAVATQPGF